MRLKARLRSSSAPVRAPARAWVTVAPRRCCLRARVPRCWPWTTGWSRPRRRPHWWRRRAARACAFEADVTKEATLKAAIAEAMKLWGRIDVLHNNVGVSLAGGDASPTEITEEAFDRVNAINLRGTIMACKHVFPIMRKQQSGSIINISSVAAISANYPTVAYKTTKAGMVAFTEQTGQPERRVRRARQRHPARPHEHADGRRHAGPRMGHAARRGGGRAQRARAAAQAHGHRLGRGLRGVVPGLGRGQLHHRRRRCWSMAAAACARSDGPSRLRHWRRHRRRRRRLWPRCGRTPSLRRAGVLQSCNARTMEEAIWISG